MFFDLDGTLTDPGPGVTACLQYAAEALGAQIHGDPTRFIGPPLRAAFSEILDTNDPERIEAGVDLYRERFASTGIFENAVYPGIASLLASLQSAGFALRVVTAKPQVFAERVVDHFGLAPFFHAVHGPGLDGHPDTKTDLLARVVRDLAASPADACMVGDRSYDMEAARRNGVFAIGVAWGYGGLHELTEAGAQIVVDSVDELEGAIRGRPTGLPPESGAAAVRDRRA